jgi:hypothetical protein
MKQLVKLPDFALGQTGVRLPAMRGGEVIKMKILR